MQVQINLGAPFEYTAGKQVPPFPFKGDIVLATDPGKTNMAMVLGTTFGTQLCILQFRAPGSQYDNSDYCRDFKDFLTRYLEDCRVEIFGIEKAISKKGMNHHHSSMVLTEIRANLIDLAYHLTGNKPYEINNWAWKYAILPDGMRSQSEKGSTRFLPGVYQTYGNADVTDAICMYRYLIQKHGSTAALIPSGSEKPVAKYKYHIVPKGHRLTNSARRFQYVPGLTLEENCVYYINRTWERGVATVPVTALALEDIYSHAVGFVGNYNEQTVEVVVVRS